MRTIQTYENTRYEVVLQHPDGRSYLLWYSARWTRATLIDAMRHHAADVLAIIGQGDNSTFKASKYGRGWIVRFDNSEWFVCFSQRTEREALANGELPWIKDAAKAVASC